MRKMRLRTARNGAVKGKSRKQRSHAFKHGWLAILITCLFIAAAIIVNVVVGVLADKFPQMNLSI